MLENVFISVASPFVGCRKPSKAGRSRRKESQRGGAGTAAKSAFTCLTSHRPARLPRPCSLEASPPRPGLLGAGVTPQVQSERNRSPALGGQEQSRVKKPSPGLKSLPSLSAWANSSPPRSWRLSFVKGDRERCRREGLGEGPRGRGTPRGVLLAGTGHRSLLPPQPHVVGWAGLPKGPDWPR